MKYTTILEKLQYLLGFIQSSYVYIIFLSLVLLLIIMRIFKKIKKKNFTRIMTILYITLFSIVIYNNYESLSNTLDSIVNNLFTNIYFPSIYAYLFILGVVDIVFLISLFNIRISKVYKIINGVCFSIIQFILVIIMEIIATNNIDVFSKNSLFTNISLVAMLELSVNVFILWIVVLGGIYSVNIITERILSRKTDKVLENNPVVMNNTKLEVTTDNIENNYLTDNKPINIPENTYSLNDLVHKSVEVDKEVIPNIIPNTTNINNTITNSNISSTEEKLNHAAMFDMILNNSIPVKKEETTIKKDITNYTLNDYKTFNKMLKEIKMYNIGSIVNIDKTLELRLLDKYTIDEYNLFKQMLKSYSN